MEGVSLEVGKCRKEIAMKGWLCIGVDVISNYVKVIVLGILLCEKEER